MTSVEALVAELRAPCGEREHADGTVTPLYDELRLRAADHIEAISSENERLKTALADVTANAELRLKLLMEANDALERLSGAQSR